MGLNQPEEMHGQRSRRLAILFFIMVPVVIIAGIMAVRYFAAQKEKADLSATGMSAAQSGSLNTGNNIKIDPEAAGAGNHASKADGNGVSENKSAVTDKTRTGGAGMAGEETGVSGQAKLENTDFPGDNAKWTALPEGAAFDSEAPPYVNALFEGYFKAKLDGDAVLADSFFTGGAPKNMEEEKQKLLKSLEYIEDYRDLTCYTLKGPVENSLVVYVSYQIKFYQSEVPAPSLSAALVKMDADGTWRIYEGEMDGRLQEYMEQAGQLDCAKELARQVQAAFGQALVRDEQLAEIYAIAMAGPESPVNTSQ